MAHKSSDVYDYYYENYLLLYNLYGKGRPRVGRDEFEKLDNELMQIISRAEGGELGAADVARIKDIEYILMDDIAEALLDRPAR
ncbi:MAG: hypothetical protein HS108_15235 [Planctomycetes bacterium]|jgi:hypothetical protein|nr:hypothetical protein [Planctomycetota bacterium]MCL4731641.1 hypothetical protein [Planctomycetota bacterium]